LVAAVFKLGALTRNLRKGYKMKCVSCGSQDLVEGTLPFTPKDDLKFKPGGRTFRDRAFGNRGRDIRAHGCVQCGHLQLSVEFDPGEAESYKRFEGPQPSVIERLKDSETGPE
jgi:hypothetical protein